MTDTLLPQNKTAYELAISEAVEEWHHIPVEILSTIWDPWRCPPNVLPYLAAELSVDIWTKHWSLAKQRQVTARSIPLSRARGVRSTFAEWLSIIDAELVQFLPPPQGLFPRNHWTDEIRAVWRARFPEIRVYVFRGKHTKPKQMMVVGEPWFGRRNILRKSVAPVYGGRRATFVKNGIELPINLRVDVGSSEFARSIFTAALPTTLPKLFPGQILGHGRFIPRKSTAKERVYIYSDGSGRFDLLPPGQPLSVGPDKVAEKHVVKGGFYVGHTLPMVVRSSVAKEHVYDSIRVYDPAAARLVGNPNKGGWILGRTKLHQKPFTIHINADLSRRRKGGFVVGRAPSMIVRKFDDSRVLEGLAAVRASKLGRDRTMVGTNLHSVIRPGENLRPDGTYRVGQIVRSF